MEDVSPKLLKMVRDSFQASFDRDSKIKSIYEKIEAGTATYLEANDFAVRAGEHLAKAYKQISAADLPDGKMYYNIANSIIPPTMTNNYDLVSEIATQIQQNLNEEAGIGLKALTPELNQDRIDGIVNRISSVDDFDAIKWILDSPIVDFSQSIIDDSIRRNAEFHGEAGMTPKIVRKNAFFGCCKWCSKLQGTYVYPDVPQDVYRRHQNCRCTVDYHPGNGKKQNVHNKGWKKEVLKDYETEQNYKPVIRGETSEFSNKGNRFMADRIEGYEEVFVEQNTNIKKRALHNIVQNINNAIKEYKVVGEKPRIVILDKNMMMSAYGKYDMVTNTIYAIPELGDKKALLDLLDMEKDVKYRSVEYHECWHYKQAMDYGKQITEEGKEEYFEWLNKKSKKNIDSLGITEYNCGEISDYALQMYRFKRYDEVEAEYMTKIILQVEI